MLHVKQPDSRRPCKTQHRKLDQEVRSPSNKPVGNQNHDDDEQVGDKNAHAFFSLHPSRRKPVSEQKHEQCAQSEHHHGVTVKPVLQTFLLRYVLIFRYPLTISSINSSTVGTLEIKPETSPAGNTPASRSPLSQDSSTA